MDNNEKETFHYTYSAKEQAEIQNIRKKYAAPKKQENKMEQLRRLDAGVAKKATVRALTVGIIGALVMGLGMSFTMTDFAEILGIYKDWAMVIGIIIGVIGIAFICFAYPIYNRTVKKEREKIAPEILRLTDELMK